MINNPYSALDSVKIEDNPYSALDSVDLSETNQKKGGFTNAVANVGGSTLSGAGRVLKDIGAESIGDAAIKKGDEIKADHPTAINSFGDIVDHPGNAISESVGQMAGQAGMALGGGAAGSAIGAGLGSLTGPLAPVAVPALSAAGGYVGANLPMLAQEYGSEREQQLQNGVDDKGRALEGAVTNTAIENLGGFKPGGMATAGKQIVSDLAGKSIKEGAKILGKKMLKAGVEESLEEVPQQYVGAYGGGTDVKDLNTVENAEQAGLGAAMAFPGGSMFGGGRTLANHYRAPRGPLEKASQAAPEFNAPTIDDHFATAAEANRLPLDYLKAVAQVESNGKQFDANGKPTNPGTSNALGVMQVIPKWHPEFDKEKLANDAEYNIHAGAQILGKLFDETDPNLPASERLRIASKRYFGHKDAAKNEEYANKVDAAMGQPMASASQQSGIVQPGAWADDQSPMPERTPQLPENPAAQDEAELERQAIQNEDSAPSDQFDNSIPFEQKTRDQIADEWEFADSLNEPKPTEQRSEADQEARKRLLFNRIDPSALSATDGGSLAERVNADAMPDGSVATPNKPVEVNHETLPKQQSNALQSQSQQAPGSSNANVAQPVVSANELNTVDQAAHEAALSPTNDRPEPTQAMKSAGNYKKGHISVGGLNISIENPQGSVRRGVDKNGAAWENLLHDHYGYIKGTVGNDKDHIDTFVKAGTPDDYSGDVFVVDQKNPETGRFDEHKVMIGYGDQKEAEAAYRRNYAKDWDGIKSISPVSMGQFKDWLSNGDTTKPMAKHIEAGKRANEILNQTEMQYIKAQVKAEKLNPKSPGYMQRLKAIKSAYPVELDKALARSSFETYAAHPSNKGVPENLLRQGYEALQQEHGVAENGGVKFSKSPMKSVEANVKRGREAMNKALLDKTTAHRAMFRTGMGWVDFVWGDEGATPTMEGKRKGAKGISHIIEARQRKDGLSAQQAENILFDLVDTIASGEEFKRTEIDKSTRVGLRNNGNIVWLTKHRGSNSWMVTGYKENPDGRMAGRATHAPTQPEASLTRNGLGAGEKNIAQSSKNTIAQNTDDAKPSKSNKKTGSTVEQVRSWLPPRVKPLLDSGKLEVVQSADDLPEHITEAHSKSPGVEGLYDYDKGLGRDQIYLVADMLTKENLPVVLSHELLHRGEVKDTKLKAAIDRFESDLDTRFRAAAKGYGSPIAKKAYARVISANTPENDHAAEFRAYMVSEYMRSPDSFSGRLKKIFSDFVASIRAFLIRNGLDFGFVKSLTPADLAALSKYGARVYQQGNTDNKILGQLASVFEWQGSAYDFQELELSGAFNDEFAKKKREFESIKQKLTENKKSDRETAGEKVGGVRFSISSPEDLWDDAASLPKPTYKDVLERLKFSGDQGRIKAKELALSALTQNQLIELGQEILPILKQFGIERNYYDTTETKWHRMADEIAQRWEKIAPGFKRFSKEWKQRNKLEQMRLAEIMHEMTVTGSDPRKEMPAGAKGDARVQYSMLKSRYNRLLPETKALLNDIERYHKSVVNELVKSLADKITQSEMPSENKEKLIKEIDDKFKTQSGPYFPLMRFGNYWVDYDGGVQMFESRAEQRSFIDKMKKDGVTVHGFGKSMQNFNKVEGVDIGFVDDVNSLIDKLDMAQAEQLKDGIFQLYLTALPENSMRKRFIHRKKTPGWEQDALRSFAKKAFHDGKQLAKLKYAPAMRKVLSDAEEIVKIGNSSKQKKALERRIALIGEIKSFLDNSDRAPFDQAEYKDLYDEYDDDADKRVIRRFERFTNDAERDQVMDDYLNKQKALLRAVNEYQSKGDQSETAADIIKALHDSYAGMMESNTSSLTNLINQGVFTYMLGFNPSSALINYFQTPGVALPLVAGRHGFAKSSKALIDATRTFFGNRDADGFSIRPGLTDAGEAMMYDTLTANGTFDRTRSHDLAGLSEEGVARGTLHRDFMLASTFMFHKAEIANREITALMAYRMEFAKTGSRLKAIEYANDVVRDAHLDYSSANRPVAFQGNAARVMLQFKMYSQGMTYLWGKTAYDALVAKNPERKAEAKNILLSLIGVQVSMAGLLGLPIGGILMAAQMLAGLWDDDDDPIDIEVEIRKALNNVFGPDIGRILANGPLSETGADFHGRLSLADLWIREPDRELEGKDQAYYLLKTIVGPIGGIIEDIAVGAKLIGEGNTERGIEKMLPHSVSGLAKSYRMIEDGGATSLTGNMIYETNAWEKALQGLGMRPSGLSEQQLQNSIIVNRQRAITDAKSKLMNRAASALVKGDMEQFKEAKADIAEFNDKYPRLSITQKSIVASVKKRRANQRNSKNGLVRKKKLDFVRDEEAIM